MNNQLIGCAARTSENPYLYEFERPEIDSILVNESKQKKIESVLVARSNKTTNWSTWHKRLGHLSGTYMNKLKSIDVDISRIETSCTACCLCK